MSITLHPMYHTFHNSSSALASDLDHDFTQLNLGIYNVQDPQYGAKGDGVSNDTTAIQAAYTDCGNNGGGTVVFPPGIYMISGPITRPTAPILTKGSGQGATILRLLATANINNSAMLASASTTGPHHVEDMSFDMNGANLTTAPVNGEFVHLPDKSTLVRCEFYNRVGTYSGTTSFSVFVNTNDWTIMNCYFHDDVKAVNTTTTTTIAPGSVVVTPASMTGIGVGCVLNVSSSSGSVVETVGVTATTSSTFTATFILSHSGTTTLTGGAPVNDCIGGGSPSLSVLSKRGVVAFNIFQNLLNDAYQRTDPWDDLIIGNRIYNCPQGILIQGGQGHRCLGNLIDNTLVGAQGESTPGLAITSQSGSPDSYSIEVAHNRLLGTFMQIYPGPSIYGHGFDVHDNIIDGAWGAGISVGDIYNSRIHHNVIRNANAANYTYQPGGTEATAGIYVTGILSNVQFDHNDMYDDRTTHLMQNGYSVDSNATISNINNIDGGSIINMKNIVVDVPTAKKQYFKVRHVTGFNPLGATTITLSSNAWQNTTMVDQTIYVTAAGSYTGTTTITPSGGSAVTVPNAIVGGSYFVPVGATLTFGVGGTVTTAPTLQGFGS